MVCPIPFGHKEFRPGPARAAQGVRLPVTIPVPTGPPARFSPLIDPLAETYSMPKGAEPELMEKWKVQDAVEMYGVRNWGKGYFTINRAGHLQVHPTKRADLFVDLKELVDQLQARGIQLPILLRFTDILRHRLGELAEAFGQAIKEYEYKGTYCCVYPIKVNQQRQVVEEILDFGKPFKFGLEAGSKPELLAVLALTNGGPAPRAPRGVQEEDGVPIICNGFKDDEFIQMAML